MRVLGIIPARGGSQRLLRKNVRLLAGKPLIAWAIEAAREAKLLSQVIVSSDDHEILEIARRYRQVISLQRPAELANRYFARH